MKFDKPLVMKAIFLTLLFCPAVLFAESPFKPQVIDDKVEIGYGVAIGDVNGDKRPDILLADKNRFVWYRNPDWQKFLMLENLTFRDNVCIAAEDVDGDGMVEVAVGAMWNPGNTSDATKSGSVHYLLRPSDPTKLWKATQLHHEPTVHRMRWAKKGDRWKLVVLPLHGRNNKNGKGDGVKIYAYDKPANPLMKWDLEQLDDSLHMTHNFDVVGEQIFVAGAEGVKEIRSGEMLDLPGNRGAGEVRIFSTGTMQGVAVVEPMHGTDLVAYLKPKTGGPFTRHVLRTNMNQGHSIACADFMGLGRDQIAVGWRNPNSEKKYGIKLYVPEDDQASSWTGYWVDENGMACENMQQADLNGDGKPELIAAGRVSKNLKIYWNR